MVYALVFFVSVLMPLFAVYAAWSAGRGGRLVWVLKMLGAVTFMGFLTLVARWDFLSTYLLWFWWLVIAALGVHSLTRVRNRDWIAGEKRSALWSAAVEPLIGVGLLIYVGLAFLHPPAVDMRFPLSGGSFIVGQGGNAVALNYHNANATQRYALDIAQLDGLGRRADGILPDDLERYHIYGASIVSPCDGEVAATVDGLPDNLIGETNRDAPAGNHVVIACEGLEVLLAHFRPGTIAVTPGATVTAGQPLGEAGNSGNSTEPHLLSTPSVLVPAAPWRASRCRSASAAPSRCAALSSTARAREQESPAPSARRNRAPG